VERRVKEGEGKRVRQGRVVGNKQIGRKGSRERRKRK